MRRPELNYFVCTLGEAALLDQRKPYSTINEFVDNQAREHPKVPALGVFVPTKHETGKWQYHILSFEDMRRGIVNTVSTLEQRLRSWLPSDDTAKQPVGLLCASSWQFLFTWLGLIYLGHPVLLIAPQCPALAIARLCQICEVTLLLHDETHRDLAKSAGDSASGELQSFLRSEPICFTPGQSIRDAVEAKSSINVPSPEVSATDLAYLHHTSGTSSGTPKPIPQSHHGAIGVLPRLQGSREAMFTTTPMYHGGPADLFRAWTSNAMMWLFPGDELPITAATVVKCFDVAAQAARNGDAPGVKYFASVPYVLDMVAQTEDGLVHLQEMDLVGVGGAALAKEAGDRWVQKGINLVSRFGSAECGFLLSSHRNYEHDSDWQSLRMNDSVTDLNFEARDNGLAELVIGPGWPHLSKFNRPDGSFATSDLFASHPSTPNAWRYHSRADAQLTLATGKKFDPAPIEAAIVASSNLVSNVLVFGTEKPYAGALMFRSVEAASLSDDDFLHQLEPLVEKINDDTPSHARLSRTMLIPMTHTDSPLDKSSKGTIIRNKAEERYSRQIKAAYEAPVFESNGSMTDSDVPSAVLKIISNIVVHSKRDSAENLTPDTDLFSYGVDSIASVQIRHALAQLLPRDKASELPLTIVHDAGTISRLSSIILDIRQGRTPVQKQEQRQMMLELVDRHSVTSSPLPNNGLQQSIANGSPTHSEEAYSDQPKDNESPEDTGLTVLLTGPTGFLSAHVLSQLLAPPVHRIRKIYLLVRGSSLHAARERVLKSLSFRSLSAPSYNDLKNRLIILPCKLADEYLGLSKHDYEHLRREVEVVLHLAWAVNFLLPLPSFSSVHLAGLQHLLSLCVNSSKQIPPRFIFCSSTASVSNMSETPVPEAIINDPSASSPTGYAKSKWVAEHICARIAESTRLTGRVQVVRVGQLSGSRDTGVWNGSEAYPLMLAAGAEMGCLPDLDVARQTTSKDSQGKEECNWIPVDVAAQAFVELALNEQQQRPENSDVVQVYHLLPPPAPQHQVPTWTTLLDQLRKRFSFSTISMNDWLDRLEALGEEEKTKDHPALKLVGFWRSAYGCTKSNGDQSSRAEVGNESSDQNGTEVDATEEGDLEEDKEKSGPNGAGFMGEKGAQDDRHQNPTIQTTQDNDKLETSTSSGFEMRNSLRAMPSLHKAGDLDEAYVGLLWDWIGRNVGIGQGDS